MPVTVVVGGQFGSEGKGKVAHFLAREMGAAAVIRVGGPNSGHTAVNPKNEAMIFQQLPTAALWPNVLCVVPPGGYLDPQRLLHEVRSAELPRERLVVDPWAVVIEDADRDGERLSGLGEAIGSTLSGTGMALQRRTGRIGGVRFAKDERSIASYVSPAVPILRKLLDNRERVLIEGTQGFGLSVLHGPDYPHVTSRDTTAANFVAEAGLSPLDVDDVVLVIRAFPIRVAGNSGDLPHEIDWDTVTRESGSPVGVVEYTSVTRAVRRVARFSPDVVRSAIAVNNPTRLVLNHLDYIDYAAGQVNRPTPPVALFVRQVSSSIGRPIDYFGFGPAAVVPSHRVEKYQLA